ncbi:MAG: hypothetical protein CFE21_13535 [Bacteroidetes bacterium B1(2017)]|nr:MAG: hypothetical protein CFE21_13535 [Bacteroidetes bacterium B1(2017)]
MKRRIKVFFQTYFYFNKTERKGLISLLGLLFLLQAISMLYSAFTFTELKPIPEAYFVELNQVDSTPFSSNNKSYGRYAFKQANYKDFKTNKYVKDTFTSSLKKGVPQLVELNSADSVALVKLPKIGPVLAARIIAYRTRLGGFISLNQLLEIYGFKEDVLYDLEEKITLNPSLAVTFNLNEVAVETLKKHPYFKYTLSNALVNYRVQHGAYKKLEDIKNIKLVNDSIYNLILPYCRVE